MTPNQALLLSEAWDSALEMLPQYDFSGIKKVHIDEFKVSRSAAIIYKKKGEIVVNPETLDLFVYYSDYLGRIIQVPNPLIFVLLHEICHWLIYTDQMEVTDAEAEYLKERDADKGEEMFCDLWAEMIFKDAA